MENISHFLRACELAPLNLPSHDRFLTVDLYDGKDPAQVLQCIAAFSRRANAVNPSAFPNTLGAKSKGSSMSPQGTGSSGPRSPAYTTTSTTRSRGTSNATPESPSITFNPLNRAAYSGRISPTKSTPTNTLGRGGLASGGAVSTWSNAADEGKTAPAWNIHQYGYMGGASQGNQGVVYGARRQITSPAPHVPSLAEKEKRQKEEAEQKRLTEEEYQRAQAAQRQAEEEQARLEEERRWAEETRRQREVEAEQQRAAERRRLQEEDRVRQEEQRRKELAYEREREREAQDQAERDAASTRNRERATSNARLNGQFLSQYQSEQTRNPPPGPVVAAQSTASHRNTESERIAELERQLEEMRAQQRQVTAKSSQQYEHDPPAPDLPSRSKPSTAPAAQTSNEDDWAASERDYLKSEWQRSQNDPSSLPPKPAPQQQSSRPLPDPATYNANSNRTDRFLASNTAPEVAKPSQHRYQDYSTTSEVDAENARRLASQQKTKAGAWASKSLLEREMERERERQREWEEGQKATQVAARDLKEGSGPGQTWDVHQYGYMGGDSQNRGGTGLGVSGPRRQIIGPRPPP